MLELRSPLFRDASDRCSKANKQDQETQRVRIAILEDDRSQAFLLQQCLLVAGHIAKRYERGADLMKAVAVEDFDALLLDWNVPDLSGIEVLTRVRRDMKSSIPVLLITSRASEEDVVYALRQGADDFIAKPVRHKELLARIESVTRRARGVRASNEFFELHGIRVDLGSRRIYLHGSTVDLSAKDFDLAAFLLRNVGRPYSRTQISEAVWGDERLSRSRTLDTHISRVRTRLRLNEAHGWWLGAIYGEGYRLERRKEAASSRSL
jgi:DNA-binding response OmpR family regulator